MELFESPELSPLEFCLWGWMNREIYRKNVVTRDEYLPRILDATVRIKNRENRIRRKTRDLPTRVAKSIEADGSIFKQLVRNTTNLSFLCKKFIN
jgi:hypothetical protein